MESSLTERSFSVPSTAVQFETEFKKLKKDINLFYRYFQVKSKIVLNSLYICFPIFYFIAFSLLSYYYLYVMKCDHAGKGLMGFLVLNWPKESLSFFPLETFATLFTSSLQIRLFHQVLLPRDNQLSHFWRVSASNRIKILSGVVTKKFITFKSCSLACSFVHVV